MLGVGTEHARVETIMLELAWRKCLSVSQSNKAVWHGHDARRLSGRVLKGNVRVS